MCKNPIFQPVPPFRLVFSFSSAPAPQGSRTGSAERGGRVQPGRRAAGAFPPGAAAEHVGNDAAVHALQGGPGQHGQRGEDHRRLGPG